MPDLNFPSAKTIQRVRDQTGIPRTTLYALASEGKIDCRKLGRRTLITDESMSRYLMSLPHAPIRRVA
jgi:excisionase family DNA binding protein